MNIVKTIPEEEMVLEFVRAEMESPRFSGRYMDWLSQHGYSPDVDLENVPPDVRKELLVTVRPGLFKTLPKDIVWHDVLVEQQDWEKILYFNEEVWRNFSSGTRLVKRGIEKLGLPNHHKITKRVAEITKQLKAGETIPKIILVSTVEQSKLVLLEGHVRATAYVASGVYREREIPAILGTSDRITEWGWF
ncbi:MAG: hypothetical protein V1778_03830 [bacterium]